MNWAKNCLPNANNTSKLAPFKDIYGKELGSIKVPSVNLDLKPDAVPKFLRPRPIPYALRNKVQEEIRKMVSRESCTRWRAVTGEHL